MVAAALPADADAREEMRAGATEPVMPVMAACLERGRELPDPDRRRVRVGRQWCGHTTRLRSEPSGPKPTPLCAEPNAKTRARYHSSRATRATLATRARIRAWCALRRAF